MPSIVLPLTPEEYEDGVAMLLAEKFGDRATVERNVRLPSRSGGRSRQIDVLVRIPVADMEDALMVVDCKRYGAKVHKKDVETFIGLVDDVGAPMGLLVTTAGFTSGATGRAAVERGIRVQVVRIEDLPTWDPPLVSCEFCAEAIHPDALPGMAYVDRQVEVVTESDGLIEVTAGYCDKCGALHLQCPRCETINGVSEWLTGEWIECEGGCGSEWCLRREMIKDDLTNPSHDRLTLRVSR